MTDLTKSITSLIERYLRKEPIDPKKFKELESQMEAYYTEYEKKNKRAKPFDSYLAAWMIHEQEFLAGTPFSSGGPPYYFWELIQDECDGDPPVVDRHFKHCTALFGSLKDF